MLVSGANAPALAEIRKSPEGILCPPPSQSAAVDELKKAYSLRLFTLGLRTQKVVAVMPVLPGLLGLPPVSVKFTALPERVSVIESERTAFSAMGLAPEFSTCPWP